MNTAIDNNNIIVDDCIFNYGSDLISVRWPIDYIYPTARQNGFFNLVCWNRGKKGFHLSPIISGPPTSVRPRWRCNGRSPHIPVKISCITSYIGMIHMLIKIYASKCNQMPLKWNFSIYLYYSQIMPVKAYKSWPNASTLTNTISERKFLSNQIWIPTHTNISNISLFTFMKHFNWASFMSAL